MTKEERAKARENLKEKARLRLIKNGMHGSGNADPTKGHKNAQPLGSKLYQVG
jgi:hypothetical protein